MPNPLNHLHEADDARAAPARAREAECRKQLEQALEMVQQALALAHEAETRTFKAEARAEEAQTRNIELEAALRSTQQELQDLHQSSHHHLQLFEAGQQHMQALLSSYSWRITWPLRKTVYIARWLAHLPVRLVKWLFRVSVQTVDWLIRFPKRFISWILVRLMIFVLKRETLKQSALRCLSRRPGIKAHLNAFALSRGLFHEGGLVPPSSYKLIETSSGFNSAGGGRLEELLSINSVRLSQGINAGTRTPLEAYFFDYRGSQ